MVVTLIYTLLLALRPFAGSVSVPALAENKAQEMRCPKPPPLVPIRKGNLWGLADRQGKLVFPIRYKGALILSNGTLALQDSEAILLTATGREIGRFPSMQEIADQNYKHYLTVPENGKYRLTDTLGTLLTPAKYHKIDDFYGNWAIVSINQNTDKGTRAKYGLINKQGKEVIPVKYDAVKAFEKGFAQVFLDGVQGVVDLQGNEYWVPAQYRGPGYAFTFQPGFWVWQPNPGKSGAMDYTGKSLLPNQYSKIERFFDYIRVENYSVQDHSTRVGLLDTTFREIIPAEYSSINFDNRPYFVVEKATGKGVVYKGKLLIPAVYKGITTAADNRFVMAGNPGDWHIFRTDGKRVASVKADRIDYFGKGLFIVFRNGLQGLVDSTGKELLPVQYSHIGKLENGCAAISDGKSSSVLDAKGKLLVPLAYDMVFCPKGSTYLAKKNNKFGVVNGQGKIIVPIEFEKLSQISENSFAGIRNKKVVFVTDGKVTELAPEYVDLVTLSAAPELVLLRKHLGDTLISNPYMGECKMPLLRYVVFSPKTGQPSSVSFDHLGEFTNGVAWVKQQNKYALLSANGQLLTPFKFTHQGTFIRGLAWVPTGTTGHWVHCTGKEYVLDE